MSIPNHHRNAIGHLIYADAARAGSPSIVWGKRQDGSRVFIDQAHRGATEGLRCECGSELVARKGDVNAWHFAHRATGLSRCEVAFAQALGRFAADVVQVRGIYVPRGSSDHDFFLWEPAEITFEAVDGGVVLKTAKARRRLDVYIVRGTADANRYFARHVASEVSALSVVLGHAGNAGDDILALGIISQCKRTWLFNRRNPEARQSPEQSVAARLEAMYPAEQERRRLQMKHRNRLDDRDTRRRR